jgi:hypothetical protein
VTAAVIVNQGLALLGADDPQYGRYLAAFDPGASDGRGYAEWTADPAAAKVFPSKIAAFGFWRAQSRVTPFRDDGHPNRPLTAWTVAIENAPAGQVTR